MKPQLIRNLVVLAGILILLLGMPNLGQAAPPQQGPPSTRGAQDTHEIKLKSRQFTPSPGVEIGVQNIEGARGHVILQFDDIPTEQERADLAAAGVRLLAYIPNKAWFASIPANLDLGAQGMANLRWMGAIQVEDKLSASLIAGQPGSWAVEPDGQVQLSVLYFEDVTVSEAEAVVSRHSGQLLFSAPEFNRLTIRIPQSGIQPLAAEDQIQWIEEVPPPPQVENDGIRARTNVNNVHSPPYGLTGNGVDIGIWDGGPVGAHPDFGNRLTIVENVQPISDHATHVAGTMAGGGIVNSTYKGMAPSAKIFSYDFCGPANSCEESDYPTSEVGSAIGTYGIEISQNSWGYPSLASTCDRYGEYNAGASEYDSIVTGLYGKPIVVVFSGGNERGKNICNNPSRQYDTINLPKTAKNIISIGATNSDDDSMTSFSSWGPVDDGRIKPDVVAPGCESGSSIQSTIPDLFIDLYNNFTGLFEPDGLDDHVYPYDTMCGTSMAAPAVSGIAALLIEQYRSAFNTSGEPLPSTIKALLIHGAKDLSDSTTYYNPGPDYASGYGRVDAQASVDLMRNRNFIEDSVGDGESDIFSINVPPGTSSLKVTLVWDDPAGVPNANPALVNDLDILLVPPGGSPGYYTWRLNPNSPSAPATKTFDDRNNVEQALISNPTPGNWAIHIQGWNVPQSPQSYSLVTEWIDHNNISSNVISGRTTDGYGNPVSGVTITSDAGHQVTSDNNGYYSISGLEPGTYTITPSKNGETFVPTSRQVDNIPSNATNQNFATIGNYAFLYAKTFGTSEEAYPANTQLLNGPNALIIDSNDNLYVVEERGSRLLKFDATRTNLLSLGSAGLHFVQDYIFSRPKDMALDNDGNIWVVDEHRLTQYDASGNFLQVFPIYDKGPWYAGSDNEHFNSPRGIAFDSTGRMFVSDTNNNRIQVYTFNNGTPVYDSTITGFNEPQQIVVDSSDKLYVADAKNYRIQQCTFTSSWNCSTFHGTGTDGSGSNQISWTSGLGIDGSKLYIADGGNGRVKKCDIDTGSCSSTFISGLKWPSDIAVDSAGNVYVSDYNDFVVKKFHSSGGSMGPILGISGLPYVETPVHLNTPYGVAVNSFGTLYVSTDRGYRVHNFHGSGAPGWEIGEAGVWDIDNTDPNDRFGDWWSGPHNLAIDSNGKIYVADTGNHRIQIFNSSNGSYVDTLGSYGDGNDQFDAPTGVTVSEDGKLYVTDGSNHRVQIFDSNLDYIGTLGQPDNPGSDNDQFDWPHGIAVDSNGNIYVADSNNNRVQIFDSNFNYIDTLGVTGVWGDDNAHFSNPHDVAVDSQGWIYVADAWNNRIQVFDGNRNYVASIGDWGNDIYLFRGAVGVDVDADGNVYVADSGNHRIQKFTPNASFSPGSSQVYLPVVLK